MRLLDPELKERMFGAAEESPGSWLVTGMNLRAAAARLDWRKAPVREEEASVGFMAVYRMLLGLAFENILKGVITLARLQTGQRPPLPPECLHHSLAKLASRSECAMLALSAQEIALLDNITPFVEWAGKYPLPKKQKDYRGGFHTSSYEHDAEVALWDRLTGVLAEHAWVMKGGPERLGGKRLHVNKEKRGVS